MTTNFERITESPEKLAGFLSEVVDCCGSGGDSYCDFCPLQGMCEFEANILKYLLKEESDD